MESPGNLNALPNRLALGTVQFGLPYGVANRTGQISPAEAAAIVGQAWGAGINTLDTAVAYGESERRLGEIGVGRWRVVSKLPPVPEGAPDVAAWASGSVLGSLGRLGIQKLHGLLLHCPKQLLAPGGDGLYRALVELKEQGQVEKIGVSIYGPDELDALWARFRFDLVQAPFNVIDRRFATSGWLARLKKAGVEIHTRSVFLQGLLLMKEADRPAAFDRWQPVWQQWHRWLTEQSLTPLEGCLGFVRSQPEIDRVLVGVDSLKQLGEILACRRTPAALPSSALMSEDLDLINPSRWKAA